MSRRNPSAAAPLFVHVVAFHRKGEDFLDAFIDYQGPQFERNINVTLVAGAEEKKTPSFLQILKLARPTSPRPQVTPREITAQDIDTLTPTLIFSQELPTWNYPSLVFDADSRFIGYWPFDIGSDRYDFGQKVDEGAFGYERARAKSLADEDETSVDDYSRMQDITKRLAVFRPKNTIEATVEKMVEISQRIAEMKSQEGAQEIKTGYYDKEESEVTQALADNAKMQRYSKAKTKYLQHNECHIRAKIHNIKYVSYTKKQGPIAVFQAVVLAEKINRLKKEILDEHKKAEKKGEVGAKLQALIKFEKDNDRELQDKINAIESKILSYQQNLESEKAESFLNSDLDESMQRKEMRYAKFESTPQNKKIWLENNIAKLQEDLRNLKKIQPATPANILEKLRAPVKLSVYSLDAEEIFSQEGVRNLKDQIIKYIDAQDDEEADIDLDNLIYMGYGEFDDEHFYETFFKAKKRNQKDALFYRNHNAQATFVDALITKGRLAVIQKIFEETLDEKEVVGAICKNNLIYRAIFTNQQKIFDYFWMRLNQNEKSLAQFKPQLLQAAKCAIEHNNEKVLLELAQKFPKEIEDHLMTLLQEALQKNKVGIAQNLLTFFSEKSFEKITKQSAENNIFHLITRFCKDGEGEKSHSHDEALLQMADEIYKNLSKINRDFVDEKGQVVNSSIARIFLSTPCAKEKLNPLEIAVKKGNLVTARFFLSKFEELSLGYDCDKIFELACENAKPALVGFFLNHPSFAEKKINYAVKLLNFAVEKNNEELVKFAVEKNGLNLFDTKYDVDGGEDVTAFKHAILRNNPEMLRVLLKSAKEQSRTEIPSARKIKVEDYLGLIAIASEKVTGSSVAVKDDAKKENESATGKKMIKIINIAMLDSNKRAVGLTSSDC